MDVTARDEGLGIGVESCGSDDKSHGLNDEGHSVECDGLSLREEEAVPEGQGSGSTPAPKRPERVSASRQPTLTTWIDSEDGRLIRNHAVRLEELLSALFERSLKHEQESVAVTFGALWRPVLALESWAGQTDA
ncbi:hypothetical protein Tco_0847259 [Tanacetum coccineum]